MKLDDFYPFIMPEVLGCPDPTVRNAILLAAIELTRESLSWTEIQDPIKLIDGEPDYDIDVPQGAYLVTVRDVWVGSRRLKPQTVASISMAMPDWQTTKSNEPVYYNQAVDRGALRVYPTPYNPTASMVVRAAYAPLPTATSLPNFLGQQQMEVMAAGAKSRLMLMPGQPWSNQALGLFYKTLFDDGVIKAKVDEAHDRVAGTVRVEPRSFGF